MQGATSGFISRSEVVANQPFSFPHTPLSLSLHCVVQHAAHTAFTFDGVDELPRVDHPLSEDLFKTRFLGIRGFD